VTRQPFILGSFRLTFALGASGFEWLTVFASAMTVRVMVGISRPFTIVTAVAARGRLRRERVGSDEPERAPKDAAQTTLTVRQPNAPEEWRARLRVWPAVGDIRFRLLVCGVAWVLRSPDGPPRVTATAQADHSRAARYNGRYIAKPSRVGHRVSRTGRVDKWATRRLGTWR
jgi:hypothetical protein